MTKSELNTLIVECIKETRIKNAIRPLVLEAIQEIKIENKESLHKMMEELDGDVKKIDNDYSITRDDAGWFNLNGCPAHQIKINHMHGDKFDVTHFKDDADRTKKLSIPFKELKEFVKECLESKDGNYVTKAFNKSAENSKPVEGKEETVQKPKEKTGDMVSKKEDLPDAPMREVDKFKKQDEHKDEKADYKYPKQKDDRITIKMKSKKGRTFKK